MNQFSSAATLPKYVFPPKSDFAAWLQGERCRASGLGTALFSHGNHEPGWIVAPGMQGVDVSPFTSAMLTPDSLSALMGGRTRRRTRRGGPRGGAPSNSYDQLSPLPPPWYPQAPPPPAPAPGVVPGPPPAAELIGATAPAPAAARPVLPAEGGGR